jgi:hypothetical protein
MDWLPRLSREEHAKLGLREQPPHQGVDLLTLAAVVFMVLFWPVGVPLSWLSSRWYTRDKVVATIIPIVGFLLFLSLAVQVSTTSGSGSPPPRPEDLPVLVGAILPLYALWGAPFTAALYLVLRILPRPRKGAILVPIVATILVVSGLLFLVLSTSSGSAGIGPPVTVGETLRLAREGNIRRVDMDGSRFTILLDDGTWRTGRTSSDDNICDLLSRVGAINLDAVPCGEMN